MRAAIWLLAITGACAAEFDPARFGAVADGSTDCAPAIQAAIDAAGRAGGGVVRLAPSARPYLLRAPLAIRWSAVELAGPGATLRLAPAALRGQGRHLLLVEGEERTPIHGVVLRGFTLDANAFEQPETRRSKAIVFRHALQGLVEDVTIARPYVGLSFRRGAGGAVARRVTVTDYQEDAFDAGGDADEVSGATVRGVLFDAVTARGAPRCAADGAAFEIEDGAQDVVIRGALVENVAGVGAVLRNHVHAGMEAHSRGVELRDTVFAGIGGRYAVWVRASPGAGNTYSDVRLTAVSAQAPAVFEGPIRGLTLRGGSYGEIRLAGGDGAILEDLRATALRIDGSVLLRNVVVPSQ